MLLFFVTPCLAVAVQPSVEWIPIKKKQKKTSKQKKKQSGRMIAIWSLYFVHDWSKTYYSDLNLVHQPHLASTGCDYYFFSFISHNLSQRQIVNKKVKKKKKKKKKN